ncbi:MAG: MltA-interacting MipA family protein [Vicinamibacteria bacterium]|nr:MltA-interacting MipA family protein [Vicinamibacteria bacterium]
MSLSRLMKLSVGGALALSVVRAEATTATGGADLNSAYVWRGITFNNGPVLQPWLDVSGIMIANGVSLGTNVWMNVDIDDYDGALKSGEISEVDLMLTLSLPKGFKAGYVEYTFPGGALGSRELFGGWSGGSGVILAVNAYYDVDEAEDFFATVGVGKGLKLGEKADLRLDASAGFAGEKFAQAYSGRDGGLYNYVLSAKLSYTVSAKASLAAMAGYTDSFDEKILPEQNATFYVGIGLSLTL